MIKSDKWLITIDLDGTLLESPSSDIFNQDGASTEQNIKYNPYNLEVINKLIDKGHKVTIVTGRPWSSSIDIYKSLKLSTMIANYNGAHIHFPGNENFVDLTFSMNGEIITEILNEDIIKNNYTSISIETPETNYVLKGSDKNILANMNIKDDGTLTEWEYGQPIGKNPLSTLIGIDYNKVDPYEILHILRRKYGNAMFFRLWDARQHGWLVLEVNQKAANKGSALEFMASYYNIPMTNTIAFGDGLNDREMLLKAAHGVAMKNAKGTVKTYADDTTDFDNNEAGVGKYLEEFFEI